MAGAVVRQGGLREHIRAFRQPGERLADDPLGPAGAVGEGGVLRRVLYIVPPPAQGTRSRANIASRALLKLNY